MAFWKWWTVFVLTVFLAAFAEFQVGISHYLLTVDVTYLSVFILLMFLLCNGFISYFSFLVQFYSTKISEQSLKPLWFISDAMLSIGMVGTLVGFMMVLGNAFNIDTASAEQMKKVIAEVASGISVALITTLTGLVCSILLKVQLVLLDSDNEKL